VLWTPKAHQVVGGDWLWQNKRCSLWAHPGMGKTSICYGLFDAMKLLGSNFFPILVIGPLAVVRDVWPDEQMKWTNFRDLRVIPITGSAEHRIKALQLRGDVYTVNYENLEWLVNYFGVDRWPFRAVVADESTKLRGHRSKKGTKRAAALSLVSDKAGRWINLTGTPSPHGLESLWGQQWFVDEGHRLGRTYTDFLRRWFVVDAYTREVVPRPNAREEIYERLADSAIALRAEDWLDVLKPEYIPRPLKLPPDAQVLYKQMERQFFADMPEGKIVAWNAAAKSNKLIQMASGSVYDKEGNDHFVHDAKADALEDLYEELGENLLVVCHFQFDWERIAKRFPFAVKYKGKKEEDAWNDDKIRMLLVHPKSAGHGLNLQYGGRAVCFFTNTWDLELRQQVLERIGPARQLASGFNRVVLIYDLIAQGTIDENVLDRLEGRMSEQDALMAARARAMT
jgi:SNF2 family DNA or RNA helicase